MKKLIFLLLLLPTLLMAQNRPDWDYDIQQPISTDFPQKLPFYRDYLPLQNTYYELNITLNNIRQLVSDNLKMNPKQNAPSGPGFQYEIYTNPTHREPLKVKYNTFMAYGLEVVKSIEITGDFNDVAKLFVYMYDTKFSTNTMPVNQASKHYKQDYAVFTVLKILKASIVISNTQYNSNTAAFIKDFNKVKEKFKTDLPAIKLAEQQNRIEEEEYIKNRNIQFKTDSIARKKENETAYIEYKNSEVAKPKESVNVYYFKKSSNKIEFKNQPDAEIESQIIEKANGYKKGKYSAYVTITTVSNSNTYDVKINTTNANF